MASRPMIRQADQPFTCPCSCATWSAQDGWGTNTTYHQGEITPQGTNCDTICPDCPDAYSIAPSGVGGGVKPIFTAPSTKSRR